MFDVEALQAADIEEAGRKRRERLREAVCGDGTFSEESHVEHVACAVESAKATYAKTLEASTARRKRWGGAVVPLPRSF